MHSFDRPEDSPEDDSRRISPTPQKTQTIKISYTNVEVSLPSEAFQRSACANIRENHFEDSDAALKVLQRADNDMLAAVEVAEHYYEVIELLKNRMEEIDDKLWHRFLLAGPRLLADQQGPQLSYTHQVDLAFANILYSAACICEIEVKPTNNQKSDKLTEAALISCAHSLLGLSESFDFINSSGELPIPLLEKRLDDLTFENCTSVEMLSAIYDLTNSFGNTFEELERLKKEHGTLADHLYNNLSAELIVDREQTIRKNYQLLRAIQEMITERVSEQTWASTDDFVSQLATPGGAHLCCNPSTIFANEDLRIATLGIIREVNREVSHILLLGKVWVSIFASNDPLKRSEDKIAKLINNWINDPAAKDEHSLIDELKIPVISQEMDNAYTFFRHLKNNQRSGKSCVEIIIEPKGKNTFAAGQKFLVVGTQGCRSFFKSDYTSFMLSETKAENSIDFGENLGAEQANRYLPVAAAGVANQYKCGLWKSGYVPGPVIFQIQNEANWTSPETQLSNFFRVSKLETEKDPSKRFFDHYIFIHKNEKERVRKQKKKNPIKLVLT